MTRDEIKNTPELVDFLLDESVIADSRKKLHERMDKICNLAIKALEQELCNDAISRQAVLDIAKTSKSNWIDNSVLFKRVDALPPIIPQPKMGRWIRVDKDKLKCSECEVVHFIAQYPQSAKINYCPNCGRKMQEVEEEMKKTELKLHPCYCGGEMKIKKVAKNGGMDGTYWDWELTCNKCGLTKTYAADGFYGRPYKTFEEVVDDWNKNKEKYDSTGRWEWVQYDSNPNIGDWRCSECRCVVVECVNRNSEGGGIPLYKYCPQCGCRIIEPQENMVFN